MLEKLKLLYGEEKGKATFGQLQKIISDAKTSIKCEERELWSEKDIFLITYADSFQENDTPSLKTLTGFLDKHLNGFIENVHILPFYPYSSDRGFSVIDLFQVKKEFGSWDDIHKITENYRLMADLVLNHVSIKHDWFQKFLADDSKYRDYFIWFEKDNIPHHDLKKVSRPRATPLLTPFNTKSGEKWVWTTFSVEDSTDQVDLNYANPAVLNETVKNILFLLEKGVRVFRLDAIPFIWKEIGTDCESLPQTHVIISVLRDVLDQVCPTALIISQSSVPLEENLSYFGKQDKESNIIYNFALPPLVLNSFFSGNNKHLNDLAEKMVVPDPRSTFFNMLAVHDGVSLNGARGILSNQELEQLVKKTKEKGGELGYSKMPDGGMSVRELNITWWSILGNIEKFITSYAIAFSLKGIPAVYYLSLFGQENDQELFSKTGIKRDINRSNLDLKLLGSKLVLTESKENEVFTKIKELINKRKSFKAFHPNSQQKVLNLDSRVFALLRGDREKVLALHNLSGQNIGVKYQDKNYELKPYGFLWERL